MTSPKNGQYLRLKRETPAVEGLGGKRTAVTVPSGAIICPTNARNPDNPHMIEVVWQDARVFMFEVDVQERGEKIVDAAAH